MSDVGWMLGYPERTQRALVDVAFDAEEDALASDPDGVGERGPVGAQPAGEEPVGFGAPPVKCILVGADDQGPGRLPEGSVGGDHRRPAAQEGVVVAQLVVLGV